MLARFKRPRSVSSSTDFPKTPIGKIQKNLLKEPYWIEQRRRYERPLRRLHRKLDWPKDRILEIVMGGPRRLSTADHDMHRELAEIWRDVDADALTRSWSSEAKARGSRQAAT